MAKVISYQFLAGEVNHGTKEDPVMVQIIQDKRIICSTQAVFDLNYPTAEKEAISGTIDVSGEFDEISEPTWQDKIEAQVTYNSMMLGTLIEEV